MQIPVLTLPRAVPPERIRPPQTSIPQHREEREQFKQRAVAYVEQFRPVPPLSFQELRRHADTFVDLFKVDPIYRDFAAVLLNSEVWRESLAAVPFERRLLLLPKCLRIEDKCPAPFDDFGLLCKQCGLCSIQEMQAEAERLGYAVLVAEGSALVMAIIATGKIDAIVGVSCLSVLEKAFPYMESAAIPGVAIPLLQDDCKDTTIDTDWVWDVIHLTSEDQTYRMNLDALRSEVDAIFTAESLYSLLGPGDTQTDQIARAWLGRSGKRWRPFLTACAYKAMQDDPNLPLSDGLKRLCVAVECFHKASLVHDDIEDDDDLRYGAATVHAEHGIPVALNVGDLLLGEGYRLIAESDAPAEARAEMLRVAAMGHRDLSLGQGAELCWARAPVALSTSQVIDIFRKKTAPAFEVALRVGAVYGGADAQISDVLAQYSEALGIAYQIRDDVEDLVSTHAGNDLTAQRPTLPLALLHERTKDVNHALSQRAWMRVASPDEVKRVRDLISELGVEDRCRGLLDSYKEEAIRSLAALENASLKGLLRRVISKIFTVEVRNWCSEFEARMLQVARLAPKLLDEAAGLVAGFLRSQQNDDGGFKNRAGDSDVYYTVFGLEGLIALQVEAPVARVRSYLQTLPSIDSMDLVHTCCLARCWANLPAELRKDSPAQRLADRIESFRSADGGYNTLTHRKHGTVYGCFLAAAGYGDAGVPMPDAHRMLDCLSALRCDDGSYSNQRELPIGLTTSSAAAATLLRHLGEPADAALGDWLLDRCVSSGGFLAIPDAPMPDLLSTATALHALAGMQRDLGL